MATSIRRPLASIIVTCRRCLLGFPSQGSRVRVPSPASKERVSASRSAADFGALGQRSPVPGRLLQRNLQVSAVSPRIVVGQGFIPRRYTVDSKMRYFGFAVGFAFAVVWMTVGLGSAIVCGLVAGLGYGAVIVAERARANETRRRSRRRMTRRVLSPRKPTTAGRSRSARSCMQRPGSTGPRAESAVSGTVADLTTGAVLFSR